VERTAGIQLSLVSTCRTHAKHETGDDEAAARRPSMQRPLGASAESLSTRPQRHDAVFCNVHR